MINWRNARKFCCEKISLIENYDKARRDLIETWDIHHRKEEEGYSMQELKDLGMYYNRPACELVFLTKKEHVSLHKKGNKFKLGKRHTEESRRKQSNAMKGKTGEKSNSSKPVNQIDRTTLDIIKTWPCSAEVQRKLGISSKNISLCCLGKRKSAGGYGWRHAS